MKLLLDTHIFLRMMWGRDLSPTAITAILDANNDLYLSAASYWELCSKVSLGKLQLAENWSQQFEDEMRINRVLWLPIEKAHCRKLLELPFHHGDPFDRLLIAQALCEQMTVVTADGNFQRYPAPLLW